MGNLTKKSKRRKKPTKAEVLAQELDDFKSMNEALKAEISEKSRDITRLRKILGKQELIADAVREAVKAYPTRDPGKIIIPKREKEHRQETWAVLQLGDAHIGEYVTEESTDNWGKYNYDIAKHRMHFLIDKFLSWVADCRTAGWNITKFAVPCVGDFVSGNIHEELVVNAEFPLPVQIVRAGALHADAIYRLSQHCNEMKVFVVPGNHDRLTKKPQYKQRMSNSAAYPVGEYIKHTLLNQKHVSVDIIEAPSKVIEINGQKFLISHGSDAKAWMGIPWYGIARSEGREAQRRMHAMLEQEQNAMGYTYRIGGHWHVPFWLYTWLFTGSLRGTDEFDHAAGRHAPPTQLGYLVHKKRGVFNGVYFRCDG